MVSSSNNHVRFKRPLIIDSESNILIPFPNPNVNKKPFENINHQEIKKKIKVSFPEPNSLSKSSVSIAGYMSTEESKNLFQNKMVSESAIKEDLSKDLNSNQKRNKKMVAKGGKKSSKALRFRGLKDSANQIAHGCSNDRNEMDGNRSLRNVCKMESLDFDQSTLEIFHPNPKIKEKLTKFFERMQIEGGGKIVLKMDKAPKAFDELASIYDNRKDPQPYNAGPEYTKNASFFRNLIRKGFKEIWFNQQYWFNFWANRTGINLKDELKDRGILSTNCQRLLAVFLYFVDMIDTIIPPNPTNQSFSSIQHKNTLFKIAILRFQAFEKNNSSRILSQIHFHGNLPAFVWDLLYFWLKDPGNLALKELAYNPNGLRNSMFKKFFNAVFKFSCTKLNLRVKYGPNMS
ncbi:hypothetical protein PGTUg99_024001 [Puccinia graminis f. sp. tritici]|uniref:Uncharacterized protein n=1 Tax=Puccinia graminis f. sp. tritici TaxID=56615 RepID=A0A5B0Q3C5_PUCGR|nr:hypothetical protein PGTUg99_024001 [Puccinia graminis f. sp. tritici]